MLCFYILPMKIVEIFFREMFREMFRIIFTSIFLKSTLKGYMENIFRRS